MAQAKVRLLGLYKHSDMTFLQQSFGIDPAVIFVKQEGTIFARAFHDLLNSARMEVYVWRDIEHFAVDTGPTVISFAM